MPPQSRLTVALAASEAVPFSKTGGLADVAGALSTALARRGHEVHLFVPLYRMTDRKKYKIPARGKNVVVPMSTRKVEGKVVSIVRDGVNVHFIRHDGYFDREALYNTAAGDYPDNLERFAFFCKAVLAAILKLGIAPDVLHANDWQTALLPTYLTHTERADPVLGKIGSLMTIHNMGYQGHYWASGWHLTGLPWALYRQDGLEFYGKINLLKGGLLSADRVTTVSPTYAAEIQTPEYGWGLEGVIADRAAEGALAGILNGIDADVWSPMNDPLIPAPFSVADRSGKRVCKTALLKRFGLDDTEAPVMGVVSRLVEQKGFDLLLQVIDGLLDRDARLCLLGSGQPWIVERFADLARRRPDRAGVAFAYDESLAHLIEAGSDIFLMPSAYEPCGLNQMYSLAYGTAPLVRATGGLNDTVVHFDPVTGRGNGFKFAGGIPHDLYDCGAAAIELYHRNRAAWDTMVVNGMSEDHSWSAAAEEYERIYRTAAKAAKGRVR